MKVSMPTVWTRTSVHDLLEILASEQGEPQPYGDVDPVDELVGCVLSQSTTDLLSGRAHSSLQEVFPSWDAVVDAGPEAVADVIRGCGLANGKAKTIVACLGIIKKTFGAYTLDPLRQMSPLEARAWLDALPGIGPKTASIVLCFTMGVDILPIDTHVFRVCWRLGLVEKKKGEAKAHDLVAQLVPDGEAFRMHMLFLRHGKWVCRSRKPLCHQCPIRPLCDWYPQFEAGTQAAHAETGASLDLPRL